MPTPSTQPVESKAQEPGLIDLGRIARIIRRRWLVICVAFIVVGAVTAIAYRTAEPKYTASAQVALDRRNPELAAQNEGTRQLTTDSASVDTEVQAIKSPELARQVVEQLDLGRDPEFAGSWAGTANGADTAMRTLMSSLDISRAGESYAITIAIESPSRAKSAKIVNAVAETYVNGSVQAKEGERSREIKMLGQRLVKLRNDVVSAEAAVANYRASHDLLIVNTDQTASAQELSALNAQLADAKAQQAAAEARLSAARTQVGRGDNGETLGEALNSSVIQSLRSQQAELSSQKAALAERYGYKHPAMAGVDEKLADISAAIDAEVKRIVANLRTEAAVARDRTQSIQQSINSSEGELRSENAASVRLAELQRRAESARGLYQAFLDRYRGAVARQGTDRSSAYIIARALPPTHPTTPNPIVYGILGLMAAFATAIGAVALLQFIEHGLQSSGEVERKLALPTLATVPDIATMPGHRRQRGDGTVPADYLVRYPTSLYAECFRNIRTALKRGARGTDCRVTSVTSALPGEGKTSIAISLARSAAMAGQRVLLIDCDLREHATSRHLAPQSALGLSDVIEGAASLDQAMVQDGLSPAFVLPQPHDGDGQLDLLESDAMAALIRDVRERFDLVVLDCSPVLAVAEAKQAATLADKVLLVVRWNATPTRAVRFAHEQLLRVDAQVAGVVLSRADMRAVARTGDDSQAFYHSYERYYRG
ncbi:GumC family protein [Stakelama saccharophila]|uniref:non-specific protein-tyrosine kinase n=1 Tax=Stakelama saccharophila TaxID=3075605 RepID=A0ABZ0BB76_9SPHN|nr:Wzz/FepE/Etk N-terminal domain-containing protein [Stakelama sp. W311]WNO54525.1 AAA family ATPase [Stakelama sp. W311]